VDPLYRYISTTMTSPFQRLIGMPPGLHAFLQDTDDFADALLLPGLNTGSFVR
jgi:hypothetical protein